MSIIRKIKIGGITYDLPSGGSGTSDYSQLTNKPQINGNTLNGNKTSSQLGLASASDIPTKVSDLTNDSGFITGLVVLTYGSSTWNDFITAFNANKVVFVRCGAGTTPGASTKPILAHLVKVDYYNGNPRFAEFRYDDYVDQKTYADQDDHIRIYKLFTDNGWTLTTVPVAPRIVAGDGINYNWEESQRERTLTLSLDRASITTVSFEVVQTLPATGEANVIYLVPKATAQTQNIYDEYIYTNNAWEKIGDTEIDLSGYYSTGDTAETNLADGDYVPFYDTSATAKRKTLWSNIKAKLKDYFDGIYATISSLATVATSGSYNDLSNKPYLPSMPTDSGVDCNNCKDTGFYHFSSNGPYNASWGSLIVVDQNGTTSGGTITQIAQCCGPTVYIDVICIRRFYNNAWTSWVKLPMTSDIPTNTNQLTNGAGFITSSGSCAYATNAGKVNNHTVATDVPANAVFTDTNTWRPVVDNLTSTDTDKSLTANQGKVLKGYVDDLYDNLDTKVNKIEPTSSRDFLHTLESGDTFRVLFAGGEIFKVTHTDVYLNGQSFSTYSNTISGQISTLSGKYTNLYTNKQDKLVSGTNIKTVNGTSLLGSGNVTVQETLVSGTNIKTINNQSILGSGNITISAGGTSWGNITGTLSNQTDLQNALNTKWSKSEDIEYGASGEGAHTWLTTGHLTIDHHTQNTGFGTMIQPDSIYVVTNRTAVKLGDTVLWTNPSPTASFAAQTITLSKSLTLFDYYVIYFRGGTSSDLYFYSPFMPIGQESAITYPVYFIVRRKITPNSSDASKLAIDDAYKFSTYNSSSNSKQNSYLIPIKVIGWKFHN